MLLLFFKIRKFQLVVQKGSPAASHQKFFTTTNAILDRGTDAQLNIETSKNLINQ